MYKNLIYRIEQTVSLNLENADKADVQRSSFTAGMVRAFNEVDLMGKCWELMTSNPLLALCIAAGLLPIGISIFTALRNAARG